MSAAAANDYNCIWPVWQERKTFDFRLSFRFITRLLAGIGTHPHSPTPSPSPR